MKTVTVLGGAGYIGSHLIKLLVNAGYNTRIFDYGLFGFDHLDKYLQHDNIWVFEGDIRHAGDVASIIKGSDYVLHLAGLVGDPACSLDDDETWLHNLESSQIILDTCNYYNVEKLVYASSCSVYGASPSEVLLNEGSYKNPMSSYAKTKIESEIMFQNNFNGIYTTLRLSTVFGASPRMRFDLVANLFTVKAIKEKKLQVFGGKQYRPFIHCQDVARAFVSVIENDRPERLDREAFNISVENIQIRDLGKLVSSLIPGTEVEFVDTKEDDRNYRVSAEKAEWLLNFKPNIDLKSGIVDMSEYILKRGYNDWKENDIYYNDRCSVFERRIDI